MFNYCQALSEGWWSTISAHPVYHNICHSVQRNRDMAEIIHKCGEIQNAADKLENFLSARGRLRYGWMKSKEQIWMIGKDFDPIRTDKKIVGSLKSLHYGICLLLKRHPTFLSGAESTVEKSQRFMVFVAFCISLFVTSALSVCKTGNGCGASFTAILQQCNCNPELYCMQKICGYNV